VIFLECIWESDKYILVERQNQKDVGSQEKEVGEDVSVEASKVQYESIELFLGGNHEPQFLFYCLVFFIKSFYQSEIEVNSRLHVMIPFEIVISRVFLFASFYH